MSRQINQPSNQIRLTNVSLVRLKKGKKRFEIACYKNKVLEWRSGIETDLDNVLQIPNVFLNVSKGQTAPKEDIEKAFGKGKSTDDVVLEILKKGELQVGDKERAAQLERVHNEVIGIVASKLVDPRTKRVYTFGMIEKALDMLSSQAHTTPDSKSNTASGTGTPVTGEDSEAKPRAKEHSWTGVVTTKSAKSQALDAMKALIAYQPSRLLAQGCGCECPARLAFSSRPSRPRAQLPKKRTESRKRRGLSRTRSSDTLSRSRLRMSWVRSGR